MYRENIIGSQNNNSHDVRKYEFVSISAPKESAAPVKDNTPRADSSLASVQAANAAIFGAAPKETAPAAQPAPQPKAPSLEKELIEKLLSKIDELSTSLAKMQTQYEKLELEKELQIAQSRESGFKDGLAKGAQEKENELKEQVEAKKNAFLESTIALDSAKKEAGAHVERLEKELSAIAIDIAKEVILKEVSENSAKIALELSRELLDSIKEATSVTLKLNPQDYAFVKEHLESNGADFVKVEASPAITPGGVVISSDLGNIDGSIMGRYKNLKRTILDGR